MSIKKILILVLLVGAVLPAAKAQTDALLVKAPNVEKRNVGSFHAIQVSSAIDLVLKQGGEDGVAVSASDVKYRDHIVTKVENGVLKIYYSENGIHWSSGNKKLKAFVSFKNIDALHASGACDVYVDGTINVNNLRMELSGSSDFKGGVSANELVVNQSGSSDAVISGRSATLRIEVSGASDFKGFEFTTDVCTVGASGASDVKVTVNKELKVVASGASDVYYKGDASIRDIKTSGSSSVTKK